MKILKRVFIVQFLILFIIPVTFADISITLPEKAVYNLGDKISPIVSIKEEQDYDGFFNMNIICKNYNLQYFTIPLSLEAGFRTQLTVPDLSLSKSMIGDCKLKSNFEVSDGENIVTAESGNFLVTDKITITMDEKLEKLEAKPGENVLIFGEVRKDNNETLKKGEAEISFRNKEYKVNISSGRFEHTIHLDEDAETGFISMLIVVRDKYDNYGDKILTLKVNPIPTRITNIFENDILLPGDNLKVKIILYDHKSNVIEGNISVKVFDFDDKLIAQKQVKSSNYFESEMEKNQAPGNYFLLSIFEDIKQQDSIVIDILRKIIMKQEDNFVHIENVGNVEYDDETTIILESGEDTYIINKKIDLEPGEKITIDLSKEVPQGTYDIILPEDAVEDSVQSEDIDEGVLSEDTVEITGPVNVIQDVHIDDNRNVVKKTADGMSSITGAVVGAAGYVASKPLLATTILILIIFGTITRYSWGFIKNKVKGKKDETGHLFEDFKFDEDSKP